MTVNELIRALRGQEDREAEVRIPRSGCGCCVDMETPTIVERRDNGTVAVAVASYDVNEWEN